MEKTQIQAITFDLWDTVIIDDSDEPKRSAKGLPSKPIERRDLVENFLSRHQLVARELIDLAYDTTDAAFRQVWYGQNVTWSVRERLSILLKGLDRQLPDYEMDELVRLHEDMELHIRPDIAPNVAEAIGSLAVKYRLAVISDAIFSPGRALRQLLDGYGLLRYFEAFVFSDEIGCSKPEPLAFETAAKALKIEPNQMVHIGDREKKDIAGPAAVGAKSILCTVVRDRGAENTKADAICTDFNDLPAIIEKLNAQ